jgi:hypothetical protein
MRPSPDDRRNLAQLGLTILVVGLVVAPLSHALVDHAGVQLGGYAEAWLTHGAKRTHAHTHDHERGPTPHSHAPESTQHLTALFAPAAATAPVVRVEAVALAETLAPASSPRPAAWNHPAMPQGP